MLKMIIFNMARTDKGSIYSVRRGEQMASYFVPSETEANDIIGRPSVALGDALASVMEIAQAKSADLTPTGLNKLATSQVSERIAAPFNALRSAIPAAHADLDNHMANFGMPKFPAGQSPSVRVEKRQYAKSLPLPALLQAVQNDPTLAAAVVEGGLAMSGLPADIFANIEQNMRASNATALLMGQREFKTKPSVDDPVGGKPDHQTARAEGKALIRALDQKRALLNQAPAMLASVVNIVALVTDTDRATALDLLMAA